MTDDANGALNRASNRASNWGANREDGPARGDDAIVLDHVSKHYEGFVALRDVSFRVRRGRVVAFLGPNGAGKSTTMKLITGFITPTRGTLRVLGLDPTDDVARLQLGARLGYLPENGPLWADQTPRELLAHVGRLRKVHPLNAAIDRMVATCALEAVVDKPIAKLSKGYRQRVGMAQALIHDPELLVLDEPTSGLDPAQILEVRRLVRELARDKTVLLSTHILQEVEAVADDVLIVADGRIVFDGPLDALRDGGSVESRFLELTGATPRRGAA